MEKTEKIKETKNSKGNLIHHGIGAVIEKNGRYLLIDRKTKPKGYGCISEHINDGETPEEALIRGVYEEANLKVLKYEKLWDGMIKNRECKYGDAWHYCHIYKCDILGKVNGLDNEEVKSIKWYNKEEIKQLKLEPLWKFFFKKMGVI